MKFKSLTLAILVSLGASSISAAPIQLEYNDQKVQLNQVPKKIAVYELSALDTLNALGVEASIIPDTTFTGSLKKYSENKFTKAGSLFEPNQAILKEQKPDLIILGGRSASQADTLKTIAPTINLWPNTQKFDADLQERTFALAKLFNKEKIAQEKLKKIKDLQAQLKKQTQGKKGLMVFAMGENFMPHAENERFGFVYDFSGLQPTLKPVQQTNAPRPAPGSPEALKAAQVNLERLEEAVKNNPDFIIVLDRGAVNTQKYTAQDFIQKHPVLKNAEAVKNKKVIYVDADAWYLTGPGLDNTAFMLQELIKGTKASS